MVWYEGGCWLTGDWTGGSTFGLVRYVMPSVAVHSHIHASVAARRLLRSVSASFKRSYTTPHCDAKVGLKTKSDPAAESFDMAGVRNRARIASPDLASIRASGM